MLPKIQHGLAILALLFVTGCANTYNRVEMGGTERTHTRLDESAAVLVMMPKDGGNGRKSYGGSGAVVAHTIDAAFSRYARLVDIYPTEYHSLNEIKDIIAKNDYKYIIIPTVVSWTYGGANWSKTATQVGVKISIIDAISGRTISSNFLESKGPSASSIYTLLDSDTEGPEELLSNLADDYVDDLYGALLSFPR